MMELFPVLGYPHTPTLHSWSPVSLEISAHKAFEPSCCLAETQRQGQFFNNLFRDSSSFSFFTRSALFITSKTFFPFSRARLSSPACRVRSGNRASSTSMTTSACSTTLTTLDQCPLFSVMSVHPLQ